MSVAEQVARERLRRAEDAGVPGDLARARAGVAAVQAERAGGLEGFRTLIARMDAELEGHSRPGWPDAGAPSRTSRGCAPHGPVRTEPRPAITATIEITADRIAVAGAAYDERRTTNDERRPDLGRPAVGIRSEDSMESEKQSTETGAGPADARIPAGSRSRLLRPSGSGPTQRPPLRVRVSLRRLLVRRAVLGTVVATAALVVSYHYGGLLGTGRFQELHRFLAIGGAIVFLVSAVSAVRSGTSDVVGLVRVPGRLGDARAGTFRLICLLAG